jgi:hypothetical protein
MNETGFVKGGGEPQFFQSYISGGDDPLLPSFDPGRVFFPDVPRRALSRRDPTTLRWLLGIELESI